MLKQWHLILCSLFLLIPTIGWSMPCHCYSQRTFDPNQPNATDAYFLATAQNSFFASVYGVEKRTVVLIKQKPSTTSERLWVAQWLADRTSHTPGDLLKVRHRSDSWLTALTSLNIDPATFGEEFCAQLDSFNSDSNLAHYVVDDVLCRQRLIDQAQLQALRTMGSEDAETILSCLLALKTGQSASEFYHAVKLGGASWGVHLLNAEMDGSQMINEIKQLLPSS